MRRAIAFLTVFGRAGTPTPRTFDWFPLVGAIMGLAVGGVWWAAGRFWAPMVAAGIAVVADVAVTGYLHFDGLADAADGLLPPMSRVRRLEVMRDPSVGAFAAVTVTAVLLLRFAAFATTRPALLVVAALWCGSRTAMTIVARTLPYARQDGGLATAFVTSPEGAPPRPGSRSDWTSVGVVTATAGIVGAVALGLLGRGLHGLAAVGAEALAAAAMALFAWRRVGGYTGDVLGASGVVAETVGLLILATR